MVNKFAARGSRSSSSEPASGASGASSSANGTTAQVLLRAAPGLKAADIAAMYC